MPTTDVPALAANNGHNEVEDVVVQTLRTQIAQRRVKVEQLQTQLAELTPELKRYEKALALLLDEAPPPGPGRPRGPQQQKRVKESRVGPDRMAAIERVIREYADDHEEFRQVDIRSVYDMTSSISATAFDQLRQANIIRLARQDGNSKWYRLTRQAMGQVPADPQLTTEG